MKADILQRYEESLTAYNRASGLMVKGRYEDAEPILREALARYPRQLLIDGEPDADPAIKGSFETLFAGIKEMLENLDSRLDRELKPAGAAAVETYESLQDILDRNLRLRVERGAKSAVPPFPGKREESLKLEIARPEAPAEISEDFGELTDAPPPPPEDFAEDALLTDTAPPPPSGISQPSEEEKPFSVKAPLPEGRAVTWTEPAPPPPAEAPAAEEPPPVEEPVFMDSDGEPVQLIDVAEPEAPPAEAPARQAVEIDLHEDLLQQVEAITESAPAAAPVEAPDAVPGAPDIELGETPLETEMPSAPPPPVAITPGEEAGVPLEGTGEPVKPPKRSFTASLRGIPVRFKYIFSRFRKKKKEEEQELPELPDEEQKAEAPPPVEVTAGEELLEKPEEALVGAPAPEAQAAPEEEKGKKKRKKKEKKIKAAPRKKPAKKKRPGRSLQDTLYLMLAILIIGGGVYLAVEGSLPGVQAEMAYRALKALDEKAAAAEYYGAAAKFHIALGEDAAAKSVVADIAAARAARLRGAGKPNRGIEILGYLHGKAVTSPTLREELLNGYVALIEDQAARRAPVAKVTLRDAKQFLASGGVSLFAADRARRRLEAAMGAGEKPAESNLISTVKQFKTGRHIRKRSRTR